MRGETAENSKCRHRSNKNIFSIGSGGNLAVLAVTLSQRPCYPYAAPRFLKMVDQPPRCKWKSGFKLNCMMMITHTIPKGILIPTFRLSFRAELRTTRNNSDDDVVNSLNGSPHSSCPYHEQNTTLDGSATILSPMSTLESIVERSGCILLAVWYAHNYIMQSI